MWRFVSLCVLAAGMLAGQTAPRAHEIRVTVERLEGDAWRPIDPKLVLSRNDRVRFRFQSNFSGYLYVINQGTSGEKSQLFPRREMRQNRVTAGRSYLIPSDDAAFRIAGPAGQDVLYWMVTPVALGNESALPPGDLPVDAPPMRITPRCDDTLLKARGQCLDSSAGPRLTPRGAQSGGEGRTPDKEVFVIRNQDATVVSSPQPFTAPVIYEFRLAHQ